MGIIRIAAPPESLYFFGTIMAVDMETEHELARISPGETMELPADSAIDLGIAWGRLGAPAVRLRFTAHPGRTYVLHWLMQGFGAGMALTEDNQE